MGQYGLEATYLEGIEQTTFGEQRHSKVEKKIYCRRYHKVTSKRVRINSNNRVTNNSIIT